MNEPPFTLSGKLITETETGYTGELILDNNRIRVQAIITRGPKKDVKSSHELAVRMIEWYYSTFIERK